ncbi:MAG TPA: FAD-dependent oxidoreductase [Propionibacteriaceae bacterium]|jgi:3-phenylpropionate/trans-cinnamate dioxygenase ferredoxin reductase component|nr:FAD-dependent oxidoreductase [Propionibacteriaceae bacterium]
MTQSPTSQPSRIVIIGAALAGASAAIALRDQGYQGELTVIGEEGQLPYERPPLSKVVLIGERDEPDWVAEEATYEDKGISLKLGTTATRIDRGRKVVVASRTEYPYDKLLIATGAGSRRLDLPGADLDGLLTLRTLEESLALRERFTEGARIVIVGGGWIGCEAAAAARQHGANVTMIEPRSQPLLQVCGEQIGATFAALHHDHGVDLRLGIGVTGFAGDGAVSSVHTKGHASVPADIVLIAVGAAPNIALADVAGLQLANGGIAVDATLRSSDPDIYAVGDVAAHDHPKYPHRIRVEHWANAKDQGAHVALNLLGAEEPYLLRPFFFSDQYDLGCEYRGFADPTKDRLVVRGDLKSREFTAFWVRAGAVAAAMNVNQWDDADTLQELVDSGRQVSDKELVSL